MKYTILPNAQNNIQNTSAKIQTSFYFLKEVQLIEINLNQSGLCPFSYLQYISI